MGNVKCLNSKPLNPSTFEKEQTKNQKLLPGLSVLCTSLLPFFKCEPLVALMMNLHFWKTACKIFVII